MSKNTIIVRTFPAGAAASGEAYSIKRESDNFELASGTTSAAGLITYAPNGSPGPWRWEVDTGDTVRKGSSKHAGSGGSYSLAEIPVALRLMGKGVIDGYLNELAVTDPDSGTNLSVATGAVIANGIIAVWNTSATHAVATAQDATNPKACYLGVTITGAGEAEEGKAVLTDVCGAAAASPSLPSLTSIQTEASWFEPLATFTLGNSASSNANDVTAVTDVRRYALTRNAQLAATAYRTDAVTPQTVTSTTGADVTWSSGSTGLTLASGIVYDLRAEVFLLVQAPSGQTISIAPYINGVGNIATFVPSGISSGYVGLGVSYSLNSVTGAGAAITNGVRVKVSSGTGNVMTGSAIFTAVPRS